MHSELQPHVAFHLTGRKTGDGLEAVEQLGLRPALFANYRDLSSLRYDYPLVLAQDENGDACVRSLTGVMDDIVRGIAPAGTDGDRLAKHVMRLEREIRGAVAKGTTGTLTRLWDAAEKRLAAKADASFVENLRLARSALTLDGEVVDCTKDTPSRLLTHLWHGAQQRKARQFHAVLQRLTLKLGDMLKANFVRSDAGISAASLKASVGAIYHDAIDFDAMSGVLAKMSLRTQLPAAQRARVEDALAVLKSQRFFVSSPSASGSAKAYSFVFDSCDKAMQAYRNRHPEMTAVAKAMAIAELETQGLYQESKHDPLFDGFGDDMLDAQDAALFPDYLVCLAADKMDAAESAQLMEMLNAGLPVKVLLQSDDILSDSSLTGRRTAGGVAPTRLARMAIEVDDAYVLQTTASHLHQAREQLVKGLSYTGPALLSVYSGASASLGDLPPYLAAAAAMESRAFPAFTYDPSAGTDLASRFDLKSNSQPDRAWPVESFGYEDADHQRTTQDIAFTFVDFVACDTRCARHFARVQRDKWNGSLVPVADALAKGAADKVPATWMVDGDNKLHKVIVDQKVLSEARRCSETWHSLQELGGIHNSHFERLLAIEKQAWESQHAAAAPAAPAAPAAAAAQPAAAPAPAAAAAPAPAAEAETEKASEDAYIETPRCTTCNECTNLNDRMFGYDANKQAFVKDVNAGTYRQLVEAAENCQVSIIHPGKPRNMSEPGLDELVKRAEAFL